MSHFWVLKKVCGRKKHNLIYKIKGRIWIRASILKCISRKEVREVVTGELVFISIRYKTI